MVLEPAPPATVSLVVRLVEVNLIRSLPAPVEILSLPEPAVTVSAPLPVDTVTPLLMPEMSILAPVVSAVAMTVLIPAA